ncbi:T9SS-dependent choice-of-anchor J family protein [Flavobacterium sp.]|uniref:T9SS-dependent choice-of-anchor J family protein n=1 Tax=Flavobacterium sp. TaxID=239 RepID=UPI0028BE11E4|nr:choice-of-anchor J domain-containing protein [Flavobacterium sp.]
MIRKLLFWSLGFAFSIVNGQNLMTENFDVLGDPVTLPAGWTVTNQSNPVGTIGWFRGGGGTTFAGYNGGQTGYIGANYNNTAGTGVISNWLMSPVLTLENGDVISFYTRTATGSTWADNLELRLSTNGAGSVNPSGTTGVGDYTTLGVTVNTIFPTASGYPQVWTQYSYTVSGLAGATSCRVAFRYTVPTSAGPSGSNSNFIGIDAFSVDRTLSSEDFFMKNFALYPNPARNVLNVVSISNSMIQSVQVLDLNGRVVKNASVSGITDFHMNVADLNTGMYFVKIVTDEGNATSKFMKD